MEKYLLSLYALVEENKENNMTLELILYMLKTAFETKPKLFNKEWLLLMESPDFDDYEEPYITLWLCLNFKFQNYIK